MFDREELTRVLLMQQNGYALLQGWMASRSRGSPLSLGAPPRPRCELAHQKMATADIAFEWLDRNFKTLPEKLRPDRAHLREFACLFVSFLTTSFEAQFELSDEGPYHCLFCATMHDPQGLRLRQPSKRAEEVARGLMRIALNAIGENLGYPMVDGDGEELLRRPDAPLLDIAWLTYGQEIIRRSKFASQGEGVLVLWRKMTRMQDGKWYPDFELTTERLLAAEESVKRWVSSVIMGGGL